MYVVSVCSEHQAMVELAHTVRTEGALQHKQRRESYRRVRETARVSGRKDGNNKYKVKLKDGETFEITNKGCGWDGISDDEIGLEKLCPPFVGLTWALHTQ